jgi:putative transposase
MAEYRHSVHTVFDLKYRVVWRTKYRCQIWETREVVIVRGAVSPDHIHLLLSAPPVLSPGKMVQYIKGRSSRHLQAEFPELRTRYSGQHMWARG